MLNNNKKYTCWYYCGSCIKGYFCGFITTFCILFVLKCFNFFATIPNSNISY